jgi:hypothetical protein
MPNQAYPSLNDIEPSWADIATTFTVYGGDILDMADIAALKWNDKVDVGERRGASGGRVMARTTGSLTSEASATLYRSGHRRLIKSLMAKAPTRGSQRLISLVGFDILIQHTPPGESEIYQVKLTGCRLLGRSLDMKEGNDADQVEVNLNPLSIVEIINGLEVVLL